VCYPGVLERLALIAMGRAAGFSLNEIALMFAPDGRLRIEPEELERTIRELSISCRSTSIPRFGQQSLS
jgi:hypothetical protein